MRDGNTDDQKGRSGASDRPRWDLLRLLEFEIWPLIGAEKLDRPPMSRIERDRALGGRWEQ